MKIMIFAYLDNNVGDDLMLKLLSNRFKDHQFYVYTSNSTIISNLKKYRNFAIRHPSQRNNDLKLIDSILSIGGSIFNDLNTLKGKISRIRKILFLLRARILGKKIATIGCNLGPYKDKVGLYLTALELKLNSIITVRDDESKYLLSNFSLKNLECGDDIVYSLKHSSSPNRPIGLGISAFRSTHSNEVNDENYSAISKIIDEYVSRTGNSVRLFAFDSEGENDIAAAHHIYNRSSQKSNIEIVCYLGDLDDFLFKFSECNRHIAIRFHSAVLSDLMGIPFIPYAYSNKMRSLIEKKYPKSQINGIESLRLDVLDCKKLVDLIQSRDLLCNGGSAKESSEIHFNSLAKIIN